MKAIILAAGRGSRMGNLTKEKPKCLTILNGKPLIEHQLDSLSKAGIKKIGIVTGYKPEYLKKYGNRHFHNHLWEKTNMVYSLFCAQEWLETEDCIISYSDIFYGARIINDLIKSPYDVTIAYDPNWLELWSKRFENPLEDAETFQQDQNGFLVEIGSRAKSIEEIKGQYMGLLKIKKEFWKRIKMSLSPAIDITSFLKNLIKMDYKIKVIPNQETWGEIDQERDLNLYSN